MDVGLVLRVSSAYITGHNTHTQRTKKILLAEVARRKQAAGGGMVLRVEEKLIPRPSAPGTLWHAGGTGAVGTVRPRRGW
jgi:hypothetical protein